MQLLVQRDLPNWGLPARPQTTSRFVHNDIDLMVDLNETAITPPEGALVTAFRR